MTKNGKGSLSNEHQGEYFDLEGLWRRIAIWLMFTVILALAPILLEATALYLFSSYFNLARLLEDGELFFVTTVIAFASVGRLVAAWDRSGTTTLIGGLLTTTGIISAGAYTLISVAPRSFERLILGFDPISVTAGLDERSVNLGFDLLVITCVGGLASVVLSRIRPCRSDEPSKQ